MISEAKVVEVVLKATKVLVIYIDIQKKSLFNKSKEIDTESEIINFLLNVNMEYKIVGGKSVKAWLNTENSRITVDDRKFLKSDDYDIIVKGTNEDGKKFISLLHLHLISKFGDYFRTQLDDIMITSQEDEYVYRLGLYRGDWIVDVHAEQESKYDLKPSVKINGLTYINLKTIIEDINYLFDNNRLTKAVKRAKRKLILETALKDISMFNNELFKRICDLCKVSGKENITGYNLNCEDILKKCNSKSSKRSSKSSRSSKNSKSKYR
jgi:hypothetical protein